MKASSMRQEALNLARLGWCVFPVGTDGRSPLVMRGCYAATSDVHSVEAWWTRWPVANVALACGPASGVLALDVDHKPDADGFVSLADLQDEFGPLPDTVVSRTPSGGIHVLFAHPHGPSPPNRVGLKRYGTAGERRVYAGLDVRAKGASVCLPPSRKRNGAYEWERCPFSHELAPAPDWLLDLMFSEPPPLEARPLAFGNSSEKTARYVVAAVNGECGELAQMRPGSGRNQRLFIASARLGELVGAGLLAQSDAEGALHVAAQRCGLTGEDGRRAVHATIASGLRRGIANPREVVA